ncbi:MAG: hypothetical protein Q7U86_01150 [Draconibacterium sp.]|nr:hypothetical protein [Draconibacterium sp.]
MDKLRMMKKKLVTGIGVVLVIAAAVLYLTKTENTFFKETSLYKAVPVSVPFFIELNSLKSIPVKHSIIQQFIEIEKIIKVTDWIQKLDSVIKDDSDIQNGLRSDPFIVAMGYMGEKNLTPLVIQKAESNGRQKSLENLARALYPEPENTYTEIEYTGYKITTVTSSNSINVLNYCFTSGLFLASSNLVLVQQSLLQLTESGISENPVFVKLNDAVESQPDVAFYFNHRLFPDIITEWVNSTSIELTNEFGENARRNHYRNVQSFKRFAAWTQLGAVFKDNEIVLYGKTVANDSLNHFLSVFNGQEPIRSQAVNILPKNTSFFASFTLSNKKLFFERLERYYSLGDNFYKREDLIKKMELEFKIKFKSKFQSLMKNEVITAITNIPADPSNKTTLFLLELDNKSKAEKQLDTMLLNYVQRKEIAVEDLKTTYSVNDKTEFTIFEFPFPSFPGIWIGKPFVDAQAKYAVFYKDFLVFSNTENGLHDYLYNMTEEDPLAKSPRYLRVKSNAENKSNVNIYLNGGRSLNLKTELFNKDVIKKIDKNKGLTSKLLAANWQVSSGKGIFSNTLLLAFDDGKTEVEEISDTKGIAGTSGNQKVESSEYSQTTWQCKIGSQLITKPVFTINHSDKENREVLVQDKTNKLHQIGNDGTIRWSIALDGPVMSEIFQIDYLANGKLQYLFSTKNKLYIVDRNGVNLENFPVTFPSPATNGVNVLDYDNNRIYRYFVACDDKKVYAYDKEGKIMTGWIFEGTKSQVTAPIQHFRIAGKDYIVFKDKYQIYIQNRKGEAVAKTAAEFENSRNNLILSTGGKPKIMTTDTKGTIYYIDFDGNYTKKEVGKFGSNHFFKSDDLNGDNKPEFIFTDGKELKVTDENGTVLFTQKFANSIQNEPNIYRFGPKQKKIGIVDAKANRIYLFDITGQPHPGFPLQGATEFSIGKLSQKSDKLNLIVGSKGGNLYNYTLD